MAKLTKQKARKEYYCVKCNRIIKKGEIYQKILERFSKPRTVCIDCNVPRSELTSSEYLSWLYDLQDSSSISDSDDIQELVDTLQEQRDELEERLENIPEQLQEFEAGSILQDRVDMLDDAILDLERIDLDDIDDEEESVQEKLDEARDVVLELG